MVVCQGIADVVIAVPFVVLIRRTGIGIGIFLHGAPCGRGLTDARVTEEHDGITGLVLIVFIIDCDGL